MDKLAENVFLGTVQTDAIIRDEDDLMTARYAELQIPHNTRQIKKHGHQLLT